MIPNGQLLNGDTVVAKILDSQVIPVILERMPLYLSCGGGLEDWLASRAVDNNRPNARILKKLLRLKSVDDITAVLHVHAATITDNFWFRQTGEQLAWDDVRFTENPYADLALTGNFLAYNDERLTQISGTRTPELTNIGSFEKAWKLEGGVWYLYKQGNPNERFSELVTCKLGKLLGFGMAEYEQADPYIKSRDFTAGEWNYEPAASVVGESIDVIKVYNAIRALNPKLVTQYMNVVYLDALVCNLDRHPYNYGFLRNANTSEIVSMAPNFDNNQALITHNADGIYLIQDFIKLLAYAGGTYPLPRHLAENEIREIAATTLSGESVDRKYAAEFLIDRQRMLFEYVTRL